MTNLQRAIADFELLFAQHPSDPEEVAESESVGECIGTLFLMVKENAIARRRLAAATAQEIERVIAGWYDQRHAARQAVLGFVDHLATRERADRDLQELVR